MATPVTDRLILRPAAAAADAGVELWAQFAFYGRILRGLVEFRWVKYWKEIVALISDITIGAGALIVGGGMFFVIFSMSFFTGTQVGLESFKGLQQIGAQAFTGLVSSGGTAREITPLSADVALA